MEGTWGEPLRAGVLGRRGRWVDVASRLRLDILRGRWPDGTHLGEEQLAREAGSSRGPVREALRVLAQEGMVEIRSNGRAFVRRLTEQDVRDLYGLRLLLETQALRQARGRAAEAELQALEALCDRMARAGGPGPEATRLDIAFHGGLVALSHNRYLVQVWQTLAVTIRGLLDVSNRTQGKFEDIIAEHRSIVRLLRGGEVAAACAVLRQHVLEGEMLVSQLFAEPQSEEEAVVDARSR